jgi:hypothetical protein
VSESDSKAGEKDEGVVGEEQVLMTNQQAAEPAPKGSALGQERADSGEAPTPEHHDCHATTWHRPNSAITGTNLLK